MATIQERLARCFSILRRLQRGPADRETLMASVNVDLGVAAYDGAKSEKSRVRLFESDLRFLRQELGVDLPSYDRASGVYEVNGFGDLAPLCLTENELDTLAFLAEAFQPGAPNSDRVQQLLHRIQDLLTVNQQDALVDRRQRLQVDLRRKDTDEIDPAVEIAVDRALGRRLLRFAYRSPSQADETPRIHTVEPWNRYFDAARGHLYLDAYWRQVEGPYGIWKPQRWQKFRLGRILAEGIQVLPEKLPATPPKRPRHRLIYLLAPEVARLGVSRHFEDMKIEEADEEGWVRVTATTDDLFRACRLLLGYGSNCRVTGGSEAKREMEALVRGLVAVYDAR